MPKRFSNLYHKIVDIDNIKRAHANARQNKGYYSTVLKTDQNLEKRAREIQKMLVQHSYHPSPYRTSIMVDKGKRRILFKLPYYPDRIIQWAFMLKLEPIFLKTITDFSMASVPERGQREASELLYKYINTDIEGTKYCLKMDVKKFYPSIDHEILKKLLRKKIKDKDVLIELDKIIDSMDKSDIEKLDLTPEEKEIYLQPGKGVPIGSYLSQYFANFYLSYFDHWLKEELHCKYIVRYMDDIVILSDNKEFLHDVLNKCKQYLKDELKLTLKKNYQIFPVDSQRGIDFIGMRYFRGYKLLSKYAINSAKETASKVMKTHCFYDNERLWSSWVSKWGYLRQADTQNFYAKYFYPCAPYINGTYVWWIKGAKRPKRYRVVPYDGQLKKKKIYYNHIKPQLQRKSIHQKGGKL